MVQTLEGRRLFAATAVLAKNGTLTVTGTNESDGIGVYLTAGVTPNDPSAGYVVTANGSTLGRFAAGQVKAVFVYGLGGNDRITALAAGASDDSVVTGFVGTSGTGRVSRGTAVGMLGLHVDGGSGRDRITGGLGDDTLVGGTGNDVIVEKYGSNVLDGGAGADRISALEAGSIARSFGGYAKVRGDVIAGGTPDTITGGTGRDTVEANGDDVLADTPEFSVFTYGAVDGKPTYSYHPGGLRTGGTGTIIEG